MQLCIRRLALMAIVTTFAVCLSERCPNGMPSASAQLSENRPGLHEDVESRPVQLKREGTKLVNVVGKFKNEGDTLTFVSEDGLQLGGLPNLSLERIVNTLKSVEDPDGVRWSINGTVTEFSGRNYVLISRAVFKTASPPPPPGVLSRPE